MHKVYFVNLFVCLFQLCDEDDLYCKPCNQYFNNLHNKREHIFGRKHLQTISGKFSENEEEDELPGFHVPIFTEEFMNYNKSKAPVCCSSGSLSSFSLTVGVHSLKFKVSTPSSNAFIYPGLLLELWNLL